MNNLAILAGGCFWCTEAIFKKLKGVHSVVPGYVGDSEILPTYDKVSMGNTPYAEAVQIEFDPAVISYDQLLQVFFALHDPTTLNKQGNDVGPQYRSAIFYTSEEQKASAEKMIAQLNASGKYSEPIVTTLEQYAKFYPAEQYHLDYYTRNQNMPYCRLIIDPKIKKLYKDFDTLVNS